MTLFHFTVPTAPEFNFHATVLSHGWLMLLPFEWDEQVGRLEYVYQTAGGEVQRLQMSKMKNGVRVDLPDCKLLTSELAVELNAAVKRMLNIDWESSEFYTAMSAHEGYQWLEAERHGRILACPSLWEDLAKVLLTTNCSWSQTINMAGQLCRLGTPHPTIADCHAFPTPQRIAAMHFDELADGVRAGYRRAYLHQLAQQIASGEVNLDHWLALDSDSLYKAVKSLKGFGDYAAGTVVRMIGHFDKIAIDTACHAMFAERHNGGVKGSEQDIKAHYARFGRWRGLVMWMDIMRLNTD